MASKARAHVEQARSDYLAYLDSGRTRPAVLGEHHRLHLLQMALEKTCKAFLYHSEPDAKFSHHVVVKAVNRLGTHAVAQAVGMNFVTFSRALRAYKSAFLLIEAASPSVGFDGQVLTREASERTANVEYPRITNPNDEKSWVAPASHTFRPCANPATRTPRRCRRSSARPPR